MFYRTLSAWMFYALTLPASPARTEPASSPTTSEPLQDRPKPPQFAVDACKDLAEGDPCSVEFGGRKLSGTCRKMGGEAELVCLPADAPRPPS